MRWSVVLPAAGLGRRMARMPRARPWGLPKALLEARRPLILEAIEGLLLSAGGPQAVATIAVVAGRGDTRLVRFLKGYWAGTEVGRKLRFYRQDRPLGPLAAALAARWRSGPLLIWLCDTLVERPLRLVPDRLYTGRVRGDLRRWCLAEGASGRLRRLLHNPVSYGKREGQTLIGVYALADGRLFRRAAQGVVQAGLKESGEYQMSTALLAYHARRPLRLSATSAWLDAGSPETFLEAKSVLLDHLAGHELSLGRGWARKRAKSGAYRAALARQAAWFRGISRANPKVRQAVPKASFDGGELALPYRDWPTLADWYLYRSYYMRAQASRAFSGLLSFVRRRLHAPAGSGASERAQANWEMLVEKTEARLKELGRPALLGSELRLNGKPIGSWRGLRPKFLALARRYCPADERDWRTIHGDPVFSNILADGLGRHLLLDPRGSYGKGPGLAGDRYYDWAKLSQCVRSHFDSVCLGEFTLERTAPGSYSLGFPREDAPGKRPWRRSFSLACRAEGLDPGRLAFFEAALLLSLLGQRREREEQVLALYLQGLSLLAGL